MSAIIKRLSAFAASLPGLLLMLLIAITCYYTATQSAHADRGGPYMLVAHSNQTANVGIFRIDTSSGAVSFCYLDSGAGVALRCTPSAN